MFRIVQFSDETTQAYEPVQNMNPLLEHHRKSSPEPSQFNRINDTCCMEETPISTNPSLLMDSIENNIEDIIFVLRLSSQIHFWHRKNLQNTGKDHETYA